MALVDREEDLTILTELNRRRDSEENDFNIPQDGGEALEAFTGSGPGSDPENNAVPFQKEGVDSFLKSENDRSDYDWLLTPPGTPFISSLKKELKTPTNLSGNHINHSEPLKPKLTNSEVESLTIKKVRQNSGLFPTTKSTSAPFRRLSTSGGQATAAAAAVAKNNRSATPTGRPNLSTSASKMSKPSMRSSTPTSRAPAASSAAKPKAAVAAAVRSSTPTTRPPPRSSTPTAASRPFPASKTGSRSSTPTYRPPIIQSNSLSNSSSPSATRSRSSSVSKSVPVVTKKNQAPSHGTTKMIPSSKNAEQPCSRPVSGSITRGLPVSSQTSAASANGKPTRQSCSSSRGQKPAGNDHTNGSLAVPGINRPSRPGTVGSDSPNPVLIGTKMVERVIHMRRLPPPKQDSPKTSGNTSSSSVKSSGFGRSLSKKSLDMAMRHMDIKRDMKGNNNTRQSTTNKCPASSSLYSSSSRSNGSSSKSKSVSISDSPLATSSTTSSDLSVNNINNSHCLYGSDVEDAECTGDKREHISSQANRNDL